MHTTSHPSLPVITCDQVLESPAHKTLLEELSQQNLDMYQAYPNRIFTRFHHQLWLQGYFQQLIDWTVTEHSLSGEVQQVFYSVELPGCNFMYHRSHPSIGAVIHWSPENFPGPGIQMLEQGFDDPDDYLWGDKGRTGPVFPFLANQAIVVVNQEPRRHWGFQSPIGESRAKRSVWIYLGK